MAMPVALLAMLNGSVSRETAVATHRNENRDVADAWRAPVMAFARKAASRSRSSSAGIWDYPSQQAKLCLGDLIEREPRYGNGVRIWVRGEYRAVALDKIVVEIVRAQSTPVADALEALDLLGRAYQDALPVLNKHGLSYSTAKKRERVIRDAAHAFRKLT